MSHHKRELARVRRDSLCIARGEANAWQGAAAMYKTGLETVILSCKRIVHETKVSLAICAVSSIVSGLVAALIILEVMK